jgi:hypothetical protein
MTALLCVQSASLIFAFIAVSVTSVTGLAALAARIDAALYRDEGMFGGISGIPE